MNFWLVTTDHLSDRILFRDIEDFKVAMNYVAVVKHITGVNILAFILMSNHVHFVLECSKEEARMFIDRFKGLYSRYFLGKYGVNEYLRKNDVDIREVKMEDGSLHKAIAYVLMNSVAARLCVYANEYQWGSGGAYFKSGQSDSVKIGSLSVRAQRRIFHSKERLNNEWQVFQSGYIAPESYICVQFVESLYGTPNRMKYFLDSSSKAPKRKDSWDSAPSFSDQTIIAAAKELKRTLFQKAENDVLTFEQNSELSFQLRRRFSADINQLCRTIGLSQEEALKIFDSF
jgi:REP element-mobilizing transposase RayT